MDVVWQKCLGTNENDSPGCIAKTDNGIIVSTTIINDYEGISNYHGGADAWIVNLDSLGNIVWEKCFGGSGGEGIRKIIELSNGEYYLLGGTNSSDGDVQSNTHDSYEIWIVKIDSNANIIWEKCYGSYIFDEFQDAALTPDGGLIVGSMVTTSGGDISSFYGDRDVWIFRIDSLGNILWEKSYGNHSMNRINSIIATSKGTYMFTGSFYEKGGMIDCQKDDSENVTDVWVVEIDIVGDIIFQNCYGGSYHETGYAILEVNNGYVIGATTNSNDQDVSGYHGSAGEISNDIWIFKIDSVGNLLWQNCLGGSEIEWPVSIFETSDNRMVIIGNTGSNDGDVVGNHSIYGDPDIWVVNIDSLGEIVWQQCFGSAGFERIPLHGATQLNDYSYAITSEILLLDGDVECKINPNEPNKDAWVIKIKDCFHFQPAIPQKPIGQDTLCVNTDSITTNSTTYANGAWYYEWELQPTEAGTLTQDSLYSTIHWNPFYEGPATLKVRSSNDCGESAWSDSLIIQTYMCLGTEENISTNNFRIYPNPATNTLIVELVSGIQQKYLLEMYSSTGRKVFSGKAVNKKTCIDVSNWSEGIYSLSISGEGFQQTKKIVIQ